LEEDVTSELAGREKRRLKKLEEEEVRRKMMSATGDVKPHEFRCGRCNEHVALEKRGKYYTSRWREHMKKCQRKGKGKQTVWKEDKDEDEHEHENERHVKEKAEDERQDDGDKKEKEEESEQEEEDELKEDELVEECNQEPEFDNEKKRPLKELKDKVEKKAVVYDGWAENWRVGRIYSFDPMSGSMTVS
jgi:hypothetical protein